MNCKKSDFLLYAVTDRAYLQGESLSACVEKAIQGGATFIQLREKNLDYNAFVEEAKEIKEICNKYNVPFVINDNVSVAKEVDADGVHLGQGDMSVEKAREILGSDKIIGVSTHNVCEAITAEKNGADYLGAGAAFATGTKTDASAIDHNVLREICESVKIPVVAIGGINKDNVIKLKGKGLSGVAVVGAIFAQKDIVNSTIELKQAVLEAINEY